MQPAGNSSDIFRGISDAFETALHHAVIPVPFMVVLAAAIVAGAALFVRRIRRESAAARAERVARENERRRIATSMPPERREFVRVPAHVPLTIPPTVRNGRPSHVETEDLSGGGLSFSSKAPPRLGSKIELVLELGDQELEMHGEVVRIAPSQKPAGPAVVGVAFRDIQTATREELVKWIAAEEIRDIAAKRRGPLCKLCGLPLADPSTTTHPSCATATSSPPPRLSASPPSRSATRP